MSNINSAIDELCLDDIIPAFMRMNGKLKMLQDGLNGESMPDDVHGLSGQIDVVVFTLREITEEFDKHIQYMIQNITGMEEAVK